jgi:predicted aspartyl protease
MPDRIEYRAFTVSYDELTDELSSPASITPLLAVGGSSPMPPVEVTALWDTGAIATCIKPQLKERLNLPLLDRKRALAGVGGEVIADIALVNIQLMCDAVIAGCPAHVVDFPGDEDILIGMDIIGMGDFVVCNTDGKTSFSFAIPSFPDRTNFCEKAKIANAQNKGN